jgi:hypothetical protein
MEEVAVPLVDAPLCDVCSVRFFFWFCFSQTIAAVCGQVQMSSVFEAILQCGVCEGAQDNVAMQRRARCDGLCFVA